MSCKIDFVDDWDLRYQGAESKIYFGIHSNNRCVIKHRFSKKYRHPILDKKLTKERTKRERRVIEKLRSKSNLLSPYISRVVWSDDSTLLMTEITDSQTLSNYIETNGAQDFKDIAVLIGECVAELHNLGVIHGDLTTSNLLLVKRTTEAHDTTGDHRDFLKSYIVIPLDFGLSTGSYHPEERAVDLYVLERALLSTHFSDSKFFDLIIESYVEKIDQSTCEPSGKSKILERLREVRARGRKSEYTGE